MVAMDSHVLAAHINMNVNVPLHQGNSNDNDNDKPSANQAHKRIRRRRRHVLSSKPQLSQSLLQPISLLLLMVASQIIPTSALQGWPSNHRTQSPQFVDLASGTSSIMTSIKCFRHPSPSTPRDSSPLIASLRHINPKAQSTLLFFRYSSASSSRSSSAKFTSTSLRSSSHNSASQRRITQLSAQENNQHDSFVATASHSNAGVGCEGRNERENEHSKDNNNDSNSSSSSSDGHKSIQPPSFDATDNVSVLPSPDEETKMDGEPHSEIQNAYSHDAAMIEELDELENYNTMTTDTLSSSPSSSSSSSTAEHTNQVHSTDYWTKVYLLVSHAEDARKAEALLREKVEELLAHNITTATATAATSANAIVIQNGDGSDVNQHQKSAAMSNRTIMQPVNLDVCEAVLKSLIQKNSPDHAEAFLVQMIEWNDKYGLDIQPTTQTFFHVIEAWEFSKDRTGAHRALALLTYMRSCRESAWNARLEATENQPSEKLHNDARADHTEGATMHQHSRFPFAPDLACFKAVMYAFTTRNMLEEADAVHMELCNDYFKYGKDPHLEPDKSSWGVLLQAWAHSAHLNDAPLRAEQLVSRMCDMHHKNPSVDCKPDIFTYNAVLNAWAKSTNALAPDRVHSILSHLKQRADEHPGEEYPDMYTYNHVLGTFARAGLVKRSEQLIEEMQEQYDKGVLSSGPNMRCYNTLLKAVSRSCGGNIVRRAEAILNRAREAGLQPDVIMYTTIVDCYIRSKHPRSADRAVYYLDQMKEEGVRPDYVTYCIVLEAMAKDGPAERVVNMLEYLYMQYQQGNKEVEVNSRFFRIVLYAWSKSEIRNAANEAVGVLRWMTRLAEEEGMDTIPTTVSYNCAITCWTKSKQKDAAAQAEAIYEEMVKQYEAGHEESRPDIITYTLLMRVHRDPRKAESAWQRMWDDYCSGNQSAAPDRLTFIGLMQTWLGSSHENAIDKADSILQRMHACHESHGVGTRPDRGAYNVVIAGWAKSSRPDAAHRAEALMLDMRDRYEQGDRHARPDYITYRHVLAAMANANDAAMADRFVRDMYHRFDAGDRYAVPTFQHCQQVLELWSMNREPESYRHAYSMLMFMKQVYSGKHKLIVAPNNKSYNIILRVLRNVNPSNPKAIKVAELLFEEMKEGARHNNAHVTPTFRTYQFMIQMYAHRPSAYSVMRAEDLLYELLGGSVRSRSGKQENPDSGSYNALIRMMLRVKSLPHREDRLARVLQAMKKQHVRLEKTSERAIQKIMRQSNWAPPKRARRSEH